ncbi:MAG: molybdenum cofactor guanylyltransferase [Candidatus Omnitrophica bacterium]|nr:molybdenum cofactor guanylyltransferase [Candidatus Omnitrophota bacterium]
MDRVVVIGNSANATRLRTLRVSEVLIDAAPGCGPLMGVFTGLMHTATPLNVFVSCDMPWIEGRLIEQLLTACRGGTAIAAGAHPDDGPQPFPLVCHTAACRTIGALLDAGERALQALLRHPQASVAAVEDPTLWRSFANVNTAADYARLAHEHTLAH